MCLQYACTRPVTLVRPRGHFSMNLSRNRTLGCLTAGLGKDHQVEMMSTVEFGLSANSTKVVNLLLFSLDNLYSMQGVQNANDRLRQLLAAMVSSRGCHSYGHSCGHSHRHSGSRSPVYQDHCEPVLSRARKAAVPKQHLERCCQSPKCKPKSRKCVGHNLLSTNCC